MLQKVQAQKNQKRDILDSMVDRISQMEDKKEGYDRVISEGDDAYHKIVDITGKLVTNINTVVDNNHDRYFSSNRMTKA